MDDATILCRCEDLTVDEIREWISKGYTSINDIKRVTRCGMGQCQGRTCRSLLMQELSRHTGQQMGELSMPAFRPPLEPMKIQAIGKDADEE